MKTGRKTGRNREYAGISGKRRLTFYGGCSKESRYDKRGI